MIAIPLAVLLLSNSALSQANQAGIGPCSEPRNAGTLDLATGRWLPPGDGSSNLVVSRVIYNNSCEPNVVLSRALEGSVLLDAGRIPSPTSPAPDVGVSKNYSVKAFEIGYCTLEQDVVTGGPGATVHVRFYNDYDDCTSVATAGAPIAEFTLAGLPASNVGGVETCWIVTINLTGDLEFCLRGDADGVYDGDPAADTFGFAMDMPNQTGTTVATSGGFLLAGTPTCIPGSGTFYKYPGSDRGTGLDNADGFYRNGVGAQTSGCIATAPYVGLHMRILAELSACAVCPDAGDPDADGDQTPDCVDGCPSDPSKTAPGQCGCGLADTDGDSDGIADCLDNCDALQNPGQEDCDGDLEGDACEIAAGAPDCNGNLRPDACDIAAGSSLDADTNGIPDECENNDAFCYGDGTDGPCPCNNAGGPLRGCDNSIATGGAQLTTTGIASLTNDNLVFVSAGERPVCLNIFLQGTSRIAAVNFGDGLRCMAGTLKRLYPKLASGGVATAPETGDPSVSTRSATLGDPLAVGDVRYYMTYYRDPLPAFCSPPAGSTFNSANARRIVWNP